MSSVSGVGTISSAGIGSGLDVESIVTKLVAIEKQPITNLQTAESKLQTQLSSWGKVKSNLSDLRDAAEQLTLPSTWTATSATSSDASSVSVTTGTSATPGSYSISVQSLAAAQTLASAPQSASTSTLGAGNLHIELGSWNSDQSTFTAKTGATAVDVAISATDTLADIRDKINSASSTVKASVVTDATGSRLVLRSATGVSNGFRTSVTDGDGDNTDAAGLSALAFDPSSSINSMTQSQAAANSSATINGLAVSGETNSLTAIDGMTITLGKITTTPVSVTVAQDNNAITKSINAFVSAYNAVQTLLSDQTKYDATNKTAGTLQGDNSAVSLQTQIRALAGSLSGASSSFSRLSDMGLQIQKDGTLVVNSSKLTSALGNLSELKKAFANSDSTVDSNNGFARRFMRLGDSVLGVDGTLTTRTAGIQKSIDNNEKRQADLQDRVNAYETRVRAQYTALDAALAKLSTTSGYVTSLVNSTNSSG